MTVPVLDFLHPDLHHVGHAGVEQELIGPGRRVAEVDGIPEPVQSLAPVSADVLAGPSDGVEIEIFKISDNTLRPVPTGAVFPVEHVHVVWIAQVAVIEVVQRERYEGLAKRIYECPTT